MKMFKMTRNLCIAVFAASLQLAGAIAQDSVTKLAAGLEAQVEFIGRDSTGAQLTVNLSIVNKSPHVVALLLTGYPHAIDNSGVEYKLYNLSGITHCVWGAKNCSGQGLYAPEALSTYTHLDPGNEATINMTLISDHGTTEGTGPLASISAELLYRVIKDPDADDQLSDEQRQRGVRTMNLSIRNHPVTQSR